MRKQSTQDTLRRLKAAAITLASTGLVTTLVIGAVIPKLPRYVAD